MKCRIVFRNGWWRAQIIGEGGGGWLGLDWKGRQANVKLYASTANNTAGGMANYCRDNGHEVENAAYVDSICRSAMTAEEWDRAQFNKRAEAAVEEAKMRVGRRNHRIPFPMDGNGNPC